MNNEQITCAKCNKPINVKDEFCTNCGEKVNPITPAVVNGVEVYTCPVCKRKLPPGNSFCVTCNQSVEVSNAIINNTDIVCNKCGASVAEGTKFCPSCGNDLTAVQNNQALIIGVADGVAIITVTTEDGGYQDFLTIYAGTYTSVEDIKNTTGLDLNAPMYDVLGRQVDKDYRGVIIQNGNKYLLK